jgi:hypothetical protein
METGKFFDSFSGITFILYGSAIQSTYYLKKKKESKTVEPESLTN